VAFGREIILNILLVSDLHQLLKRRQALIDKRLIELNTKRFVHDNAIGEEFLRLVYRPDKLARRAVGQYKLAQVHTDVILSIETSPGVIERMNIRRVKPYRR
jgi:hypothetical protein